jgi:hypothetical protein
MHMFFTEAYYIQTVQCINITFVHHREEIHEKVKKVEK